MIDLDLQRSGGKGWLGGKSSGEWRKSTLFSWINPCVPMGKIRAVADETFCRLETAVESSTVKGAVVFPNTSSKISSPPAC